MVSEKHEVKNVEEVTKEELFHAYANVVQLTMVMLQLVDQIYEYDMTDFSAQLRNEGEDQLATVFDELYRDYRVQHVTMHDAPDMIQ